MGKFLVKKVRTGIRFDLVANNHEVIGVSEVYESNAALKNGIESIRKNALEAQEKIEDQTLGDDFESFTNPKFEIFVDKGGEFRFNLKARNGEIILAGSEGYTTKAACKKGIASVIHNAPDAEVEEVSEDEKKTKSLKKKTVKVTGMACDHCKAAVHGAVSGLEHIYNVDVDLLSGIVTFEHPEELDLLAKVVEAIIDAGYEVAE
ncbi:MAG: DUF1508 domain-containing protein [Erysipelotrichaceae bacterium]|jgi:uncharacterized protein YegP (UPF0339 family)/copper chaperone CopZ|nr:DUF1508 domain-containing protein [Erysipelotrichaceae bacterium]